MITAAAEDIIREVYQMFRPDSSDAGQLALATAEPIIRETKGSVPRHSAVAGLTVAQAKWTDGSGNHSVGQLANHLIFWNSQELARFKGEKPAKFDGNNDETFNSFDSKQWVAMVKKLDEVLTAWEKAVEAADDKKIQAYASEVAHVGAHNAYHIGQIIYVRKLQGAWDPKNGVK